MSNFDERQKAFEAKFKRDEDLKFKLTAKRNKLIGEWAAQTLQKENVEEYIKEVRESDLEKPGDEDIIDKIMKDFSDSNKEITRDELLQKFSECENKAREELMSENP